MYKHNAGKAPGIYMKNFGINLIKNRKAKDKRLNMC